VSAWITVIGIGDDGLDGLTPAVRDVIDRAELLVGGDRHQAMVAETGAERLTWAGGVDAAIDVIDEWRGRRVVVLATGDPMWFGGGARLAARFGHEDMTVLPHPGAFSLAAARMLWPLADVETVTVHGRPLAALNRFVQPGARLLVLSRDGNTPAEAARLLTERGFGPTAMTVLEHLGGPDERRLDGVAETWRFGRTADLNTLAIECRPSAAARRLPATPGLPDAAFETDGQLTKREVRAITLARLAPEAGQLFWDVGAGSGSIAIEWLRAAPRYRRAGVGEARAIAIERRPDRCGMIARNADRLGVPQLQVVTGDAPAALDALPDPDVVFVGGGVASDGLLDTCWRRLKPGGRLVANAVTIEGIGRLAQFRAEHGGDMVRLAVSRADAVGAASAFRPAMEVTQIVTVKP